MARIPHLKFPVFLDWVEARIGDALSGRASVPAQAYAADREGNVTAFAFPLPPDDAGRQALSAILQAEMWHRQAVMAVLQVPSWVRRRGAETGDKDAEQVEAVALEGVSLPSAPGGFASEGRVLLVERGRGGRIVRLRRLEPSSAPPSGIVLPFGSTRDAIVGRNSGQPAKPA